MIKEFERLVLELMIQAGSLPKSDTFPITEILLENYILCYNEIFNKKNKGLVRNNQLRFARRLAGLTLLKLNFERGCNFSQIDSGIVYMISNPSYPDHFKIGMTIELNNRLNIYQTYDPYRRFKIEKYDFVLNRKHIEEQILNHPDIVHEQGEWILKKNAVEIFERICFYSGVAQR